MIQEFLEKLGIRSVDELTDEERKTYQQWSSVLSKPETTIEDLRAFLPKEIARMEDLLNRYDNTEKADIYYKACLRNLKLVTNIITTPEKERMQLREQLQQRFGSHSHQPHY
jgi:hypothetical protein